MTRPRLWELGVPDGVTSSRSRVARLERASRTSLDLDFSLGGRDHNARAVAGRTGIRARHPVCLPKAVQSTGPSGALVGHPLLRVSLPDVPARTASRECAPEDPAAHLPAVRSTPDRHSWRGSHLRKLNDYSARCLRAGRDLRRRRRRGQTPRPRRPAGPASPRDVTAPVSRAVRRRTTGRWRPRRRRR